MTAGGGNLAEININFPLHKGGDSLYVHIQSEVPGGGGGGGARTVK
jgi:hypothetical protein